MIRKQDSFENYLVGGMGPQYLINKAKNEAIITGYRKVKDHFGLETTLTGVSINFKIFCLLDMLEKECGISLSTIRKFTYKDPESRNVIIQGTQLLKIDTATFLFIKSDNYYERYSNYNRNDNNGGGVNTAFQSDVYLYFFGRYSNRWFNRFGEKLKENVKDEKIITSFTVTTGNDGYWYCTAKEIAARKFNTLYFDNNIDKQITDHLDKWLATKPVFKERGLIFKTGILLYGSPGTGKSSIATAIASYLGCDMIIIDTSTFDKLKINEVTNSIDADDDMYVVLLDEVDALFKSRDDDKLTDEKKKEVDKLLAFLDSPQSPNNVVFVATTNYIDHLDMAVRRKGRFDKEFEVLDISQDTARKMCKGFDLDDDIIDDIMEAKSDRVNPADLQVDIISRVRLKGMNYDNDMEILTSMEEQEAKAKEAKEVLEDKKEEEE